MTESFDKILMTLSGAVVYAPDNTPMFREIAYARIPQCKINEEKTKIETWRFQTPYRCRELNFSQRQEEQKGREYVHGLKFSADAKERAKCHQQFQVHDIVRTAWRENQLDCGDHKKKVVVFYQHDVGHMLSLLEIPNMHFNSFCTGFYDPAMDHSFWLDPEDTCGFIHDYGRPCQADLAIRLAHRIWNAEEKRRSSTDKKIKQLSWAEQMELEQQEEDDSGELEPGEIA